MRSSLLAILLAGTSAFAQVPSQEEVNLQEFADNHQPGDIVKIDLSECEIIYYDKVWYVNDLDKNIFDLPMSFTKAASISFPEDMMKDSQNPDEHTVYYAQWDGKRLIVFSPEE